MRWYQRFFEWTRADYVLAVFDLMKPGVAGKKVDTTLLGRDATGPVGVAWVHVHESEHVLDEVPRLQ